MDSSELAKRIYESSHLTGSFTLRSGQISNYYFDKYLFEADPAILRHIARKLAALIPAGTEVLAGLEMGGIPVATALSLECGIPAAFVRKEAKEYGTAKFAEGTSIEGKRVCIIEDIVTTGGQILLSAESLRGAGADIKHVLCVIERHPDGRKNLEERGLSLLPLFTMEEIVKQGHA